MIDAGRTARSGRLSGADLAQLKRRLQAVDWAGLKRSYIDGRVVDSLHQTVTLRTERTGYLTTVGTGGDPPPEVAALLAFLDTVMRAAMAA